MSRYFHDLGEYPDKRDYLFMLGLGFLPPFIYKYLDLPEIKILLERDYFCGMKYCDKVSIPFSRFDHVIGVVSDISKRTNNKEQIIAALIHDIASSLGSHAYEYMLGDTLHQSKNENETENIVNSSELLLGYLKEDGINPIDVINFKNYSLVSCREPYFCADRYDLVFSSNLWWTKNIPLGEEIQKFLTLNEVQELYNTITPFTNEFGKQELGSKDLLAARRILELSVITSKATNCNYDNLVLNLFADIIRSSLQHKLIEEKDRFKLPELEFIDRISGSNKEDTKELLATLQNMEDFHETNDLSQIPSSSYVQQLDLSKIRKRYIDTPVMIGGKWVRVSKEDDISKEILRQYLEDYNPSRYAYVKRQKL